MNPKDLKHLLEQKVIQYNCTGFIDDDPVQIPHLFSDPKNIEIAGFYASLFAWGQRKTIIKKSRELIGLMDNNPYEFVMNASQTDLKPFRHFVHRTFNGDDCLYTIRAMQHIYREHGGLGSLFEQAYMKSGNLQDAMIAFRKIFFSRKHPVHTEKHMSDISRGSAAKRLNLFLKWMIRKDACGVDFGLWNIPASALYIPLDLHTGNVARALGLLTRTQNDWKAVEELTAALRRFDPLDPVKYDYALFCMGVNEKIR